MNDNQFTEYQTCYNDSVIKARRVFNIDDQLKFAAMSGDFNPVHVDPLISRRLMFGKPIVHGIHMLLWALDAFFHGKSNNIIFLNIEADFKSALKIDDEVSVITTSTNQENATIEVQTKTGVIALYSVTYSDSSFSYIETSFLAPSVDSEYKVFPMDTISNVQGVIDIFLEHNIASSLFPNLSKIIPLYQIAALASTSRLVGMECPGLNSIYSTLSLSFDFRSQKLPLNIAYKVALTDPHFSFVSMSIHNQIMNGTIEAFVRPSPPKQISYIEAKSKVLSTEFSGQNAIVVGGSRGLGKVTAKLLAAGGANVVITYCNGKEDAEKIVAEINKDGGRASAMQLNILSPEINRITNILGNKNSDLSLYYFATPPIFVASQGVFSADLFDIFSSYFVKGFVDLINIIKTSGINLTKVLYPSTIAVEEIPSNMGEYAAAKSAGELACKFLEKTDPDLMILAPRFSRLATDQTTSLFTVENNNPVPVLLNELRLLGKGRAQCMSNH